MKLKNLLVCGVMLLSIQLFAQDEFDTYQMSYFESKNTYNIDISGENGVLKDVYVDMFSLDRTSKNGSLIVSSKKLEAFKLFLSNVNNKYIEWRKTAEDNNVTEFEKYIDVKSGAYRGAFSYGKWQFDYSVMLTAKYKIINGNHLLIISTGELQSSTNQFIKSDGLIFVFNGTSEIAELINKLNSDSMNSLLNAIKKSDDLFK